MSNRAAPTKPGGFLSAMLLTRTGQRNGWTLWHGVLVYVMAILGIVLTWGAWADMFTIALHDEEASHIFLVPIIAAWLVYVRRERFRYCVPRHLWIGGVVIAAGWATSSFGYYNGHQALWHGGAVGVVIGCVLTALGSDVLLRFLPAFLVLVFLVPMPRFLRSEIALPLQEVLARMTESAFDLTGGAVERTGNTLVINGQQVIVAEACNGLRMVFTLVLVCFAVAFGTPLKGYVRLLVVGLSVPVALLCNFIRMVPTVWLYGHASENSAKLFHDAAGWVMLFVAFGLLMGIIRLLRWSMLPVTRYTLAYA